MSEYENAVLSALQDGKRYRGIERSTKPGAGFHIHVDDGGPWRIVIGHLAGVGNSFDEAIDAALAAQAPGEKK